MCMLFSENRGYEKASLEEFESAFGAWRKLGLGLAC